MSNPHTLRCAGLLLALAISGVGCAGVRTTWEPAMTDTPLIPRHVLFGNPDKAAVRLSPNGDYLSYLAPLDGVLNVWVGPANDPKAAQPVTRDTGRGVRMYFWAHTNRHVLYLQDQNGDENWRVYAVDLDSGDIKDLTPLDAVHAQIAGVSRHYPEEILIGLNDRDPQLHDIHRVNVLTGKRELIKENEGFAEFIIDDQYRVRFALQMKPDGGSQLLQLSPADEWSLFMDISQEDDFNTSTLGFDKTGDVVWLADSRGRNTSALRTIHLKTGEETTLAENARVDFSDMMRHPTERTLQAVSFTFEKTEWEFFDDAVAADFAKLEAVQAGEMEVISRTLDDQTWIVAISPDDGPTRYYVYNRDSGDATFLFTNRAELEGLPLVHMHPATIQSRDGLDLVNYLSLPPGSDPDGDGRPSEPLPIVLNVHGGPWGRAYWGYEASHQWLANRGYAVLDANFRGSTGFGKAFVNGGDKEWGRKMHDDLIDAVNWAVEEGIADKDRIAIMGGSYGGYAALAGLTFTPEVFACSVDIVGPSNLITLLESFPPYWQPMIEIFTLRVGDHRTEEGRALLKERSPLTHVDRIQRPLLIGQGANDPRVTQQESDQIVAAMQANGIPVTYALYPDEGHGFARPENRLSFYAIVDAFLGEHLGGRVEPVDDDFEGASVSIEAGADQVQGLAEALAAR